ncbi:vasa [Salpingoeca rosetta]|uniref:RNA helicase n=1 Tax=Salpingoeca rosetta (strain ATCC 50818 / BSB-021) TaxID=946362 RepID=F2TX54_SALR5|nr:vasa [Salpingoeca rosetta]EGD75963.1 vasa [Salpingoeca rosetta]|eukprot:XP_004998139.1 vasa [Salpingoeca rosetta]
MSSTQQHQQQWLEYSTPEGRTYYYNTATKQSVWDKPAELQRQQQPAAAPQVTAPQRQVQQEPQQAQKKPFMAFSAGLSGSSSATATKNNTVTSAGTKPRFNPLADEDDGDEEGSGAKEQPRKRAFLLQQAARQATAASVFSTDDDDAGGEDEDEDEDEVDPLDAFMAGIDDQVEKEKLTAGQEKKKPRRDDIEDLDEHEQLFKHLEEKKAERADEVVEEVEYDEDGRVIRKRTFKKDKDPLGEINHDEINYPPFNRCFYTEHEDVSKLNSAEVRELRRQLGVEATGSGVPKPCVSFAYFGFDDVMMQLIQRQGFAQPTPIQAQAVPTVMSGRDVIGIAETGSGKTAAFVWPMIKHILDQPDLKRGDGPIAVLLAPTRELCMQISQNTRRYAKHYNIRVATVYGGGSRYEQVKTLKDGCEVVVATPGRLIDLIKDKATNLRRVTYLVLDEADRMFDMGFSLQVNSIINHTRPDRQTLLFTATFKKKVEKLARQALRNPVRIVVGTVGKANTDIEQRVEIMQDTASKWGWLKAHLVEMQSAGNVLVFVNKKADAETLHESMVAAGFQAVVIHGDIDQITRQEVLSKFKKQTVRILVATDVAARGLDIPSVRNVVNFDAAMSIDTHTHRIGRTGRAGVKGTAWTLLLPTETSFAAQLVESLEAASQRVSDALLHMAEQDPRFRQRRHRGEHTYGRGRGRGRGRGAGFAPPHMMGPGPQRHDTYQHYQQQPQQYHHQQQQQPQQHYQQPQQYQQQPQQYQHSQQPQQYQQQPQQYQPQHYHQQQPQQQPQQPQQQYHQHQQPPPGGRGRGAPAPQSKPRRSRPGLGFDTRQQPSSSSSSWTQQQQPQQQQPQQPQQQASSSKAAAKQKFMSAFTKAQ